MHRHRSSAPCPLQQRVHADHQHAHGACASVSIVVGFCELVKNSAHGSQDLAPHGGVGVGGGGGGVTSERALGECRPPHAARADHVCPAGTLPK